MQEDAPPQAPKSLEQLQGELVTAAISLAKATKDLKTATEDRMAAYAVETAAYDTELGARTRLVAAQEALLDFLGSSGDV